VLPPAPPLPLFFVLFFFFSSRRRHTRSKRDWSSDVCSSDLPRWPWPKRWPASAAGTRRRLPKTCWPPPAPPPPRWSLRPNALGRSEERRVGKEGWARWAAVCEYKSAASGGERWAVDGGMVRG